MHATGRAQESGERCVGGRRHGIGRRHLRHLPVCPTRHARTVPHATTLRALTSCGRTTYSRCARRAARSCRKWLWKVGAATDIPRADNNGGTPMLVTCQKGHLPDELQRAFFASEASPRACAHAAPRAGRRAGTHCGFSGRGAARPSASERARSRTCACGSALCGKEGPRLRQGKTPMAPMN